MVMESVSERKLCTTKKGETCYCDVPLGLYVVRGDSIVLLGQVSSDNDSKMKLVTLEELEELKQDNNASEELVWDFDTDLTA